MGFGVDAHSMLIAAPALRADGVNAVRFATPDSLEEYQQLSAVSYQPSAEQTVNAAGIRGPKRSRTLIDRQAGLEESFFLGLRLNRGVSLAQLRGEFGEAEIENHSPVIGELVEVGLLELNDDHVRSASRGRLLSNEVFARFINSDKAHDRATHLPA